MSKANIPSSDGDSEEEDSEESVDVKKGKVGIQVSKELNKRKVQESINKFHWLCIYY